MTCYVHATACRGKHARRTLPTQKLSPVKKRPATTSEQAVAVAERNCLWHCKAYNIFIVACRVNAPQSKQEAHDKCKSCHGQKRVPGMRNSLCPYCGYVVFALLSKNDQKCPARYMDLTRFPDGILNTAPRLSESCPGPRVRLRQFLDDFSDKGLVGSRQLHRRNIPL